MRHVQSASRLATAKAGVIWFVASRQEPFGNAQVERSEYLGNGRRRFVLINGWTIERDRFRTNEPQFTIFDADYKVVAREWLWALAVKRVGPA